MSWLARRCRLCEARRRSYDQGRRVPLYKSWHVERAPAVHWRNSSLLSEAGTSAATSSGVFHRSQVELIDFDADGVVAQRSFISWNVIDG